MIASCNHIEVQRTKENTSAVDKSNPDATKGDIAAAETAKISNFICDTPYASVAYISQFLQSKVRNPINSKICAKFNV
jgi:hypothetical protein